jgi:hypothetical protein
MPGNFSFYEQRIGRAFLPIVQLLTIFYHHPALATLLANRAPSALKLGFDQGRNLT